MSEHKLEMTKKDILLDGKPITENDAIVIVSHISNRKKDSYLDKVLDYWIMLSEPGHNGFWLKEYHKDTQKESEAILK